MSAPTVDRPATAVPASGVAQPVTAATAHEHVAAHMLDDGLGLVLDLAASRGSRLVDARDGTSYLDLFTFFASSALGMNHPDVAEDEEFREELLRSALSKPSNSDIVTVERARFVDVFARVLGVPELPHLFFVEGGGLAVENALKTAFDWKSRWNESHGLDPALGTKVLHLRQAFHGRTGYTMSLTNTDPNKVARFPRFDWPRIDNPHPVEGEDRAVLRAREDAALAQARAAFEAAPHDIACAVVEPIQGEGGDNHLTPRFLQGLQALCHEFDALFVCDEVQTGCGLTGTAWAHTQLGLEPDVVAFGKKTQVCGIMAGRRVDLVPDNVFRVSSRINSTWGGGLVDMVRARRILEVCERDDLFPRAARAGEHLRAGLRDIASRHPEVTDVRGRGLMCAFDLPDGERRGALLAHLETREHVLALGCGSRSIRFRPALTVREDELDEALAAVERSLSALAGAQGGDTATAGAAAGASVGTPAAGGPSSPAGTGDPS